MKNLLIACICTAAALSLSPAALRETLLTVSALSGRQKYRNRSRTARGYIWTKSMEY